MKLKMILPIIFVAFIASYFDASPADIVKATIVLALAMFANHLSDGLLKNSNTKKGKAYV